MHSLTIFILASIFVVALADGQYYVPRAYYTIDAEGHASPPVPLRRLRRSITPYPYRNLGIADHNNDKRETVRAKREEIGEGAWSLPQHLNIIHSLLEYLLLAAFGTFNFDDYT